MLVNNAGIPMRRKMQELTLDDLETVMRINFYSPVVLTSALLPGMLERGRGRIVNVSSMGTRMIAMGVARVRRVEGRARAVHRRSLRGPARHGSHRAAVRSRLDQHRVLDATTRRPFAAAYADPHAMEPDAVAAALVAFVRSDDFEGHASERLEQMARAKRSDPNAFLSKIATSGSARSRSK